MASFAIFSTPLYAATGSIQRDISELKETVSKLIVPHQSGYKMFDGKDKDYKVCVSHEDIEFEVYNGKSKKVYMFIDKESDGDLDVYIGSQNFTFTPQSTDAEKWKKLEENYHKFIREVLPIAKKVLKEKSSSLDEDLKDM